MHNLTEAAVAELIETGYAALTVRNVARRAGVAPATAYTYFASKEHLVAEVFWRRFSATEPAKADRRRFPAVRATHVVLGFAVKACFKGSLRVSEEKEAQGLDIAAHGESAYPAYIGLD